MDLPLLLQEATVRWYDSQTGFAALVALVGVLVAPLINQWIKNRTANKDKMGHLSETALSINRDERKEAIEMLKSSHALEIVTFKRLMREQDLRTDEVIIEARVREFEARQRAHMQGNEGQRVVAQCWRLETLLTQHGIEFPKFEYKAFPAVVEGLEEMIIEYRKKLEDECSLRRREEEEYGGQGGAR